MGVTVVDAGVVIAFLDRNDAHHVAATRAIRAARARGDDLILPASAYSEALVNPSRSGRAAVDIVDEVVDGLPLTIESVGRSVAADAAALRAAHGRSLRLPDALVLATARASNAGYVWITDDHISTGSPYDTLPTYWSGLNAAAGSGCATQPAS